MAWVSIFTYVTTSFSGPFSNALIVHNSLVWAFQNLILSFLTFSQLFKIWSLTLSARHTWDTYKRIHRFSLNVTFLYQRLCFSFQKSSFLKLCLHVKLFLNVSTKQQEKLPKLNTFSLFVYSVMSEISGNTTWNWFYDFPKMSLRQVVQESLHFLPFFWHIWW